MWTIFQSGDLPAQERFDIWQEMSNQSILPTTMTYEGTDDFHATLQIIDLGPVTVSTATYPSLWATRTPKLIRRSDPETIQLSLTLRGIHEIAHAGRDTVCRRQDLMVFDSSHPFNARAIADGIGTEGTIVQVPRAQLPLPPNKIDTLLARRLSGRGGISALTIQFLIHMVNHTSQYQLGDMFRLGAIMLDLVTALLAHELDSDDALEPHTHRRILLMRINAYIHRHLGDPDLSPATIAAAHHISTSYLHKLFRNQGLTITRQIRQYRLERCRRALANPRYASRPVHKIAAFWGFTDKAHFSRIFRAVYGMPPSDYRALVLSGDLDRPQCPDLQLRAGSEADQPA